MKIFKDRKAAGKLLAKRLTHFTDDRRVIVLGIPRGGVVVAHEVAKELRLPLDIIVTRKIGAPNQPELALGAMDEDGEVVWDNQLLAQLELKLENLKLKIEEEMEEIKRREREYRHTRPGLAKLVENKVVILVDDGIATGATTLAAINYLKRHKAKEVIVAVPVASKEAKSKLARETDELIALETPDYFQAVGQFYQKFEPVEDQEVVEILRLPSVAQDDNKD